jgi:L-lactate dehydrogenase complex protein LldG
VSAREAILARLGRPALDAPARAAEAAALLVDAEHPPAPGAAPDRLFVERLAAPSVSASHDRVTARAEVPAAVARYLAGQGAPAELYLPPDPALRSLDWSGLTVLAEIPVDDGAALAVARCGVAETGSLMFETSASAPMLPNFLCLHHIVLLERAAIVPVLEEALLAAGPQPRAHYWVTGVSGTTDIEGQYVRGAHGPRFLHVILIG